MFADFPMHFFPFRPRMNSLEFGVKHYAGQVWYSVESFLDKNRDTLRYDVMGLLISSKEKMISKMFQVKTFLGADFWVLLSMACLAS